jgi:hypothetical protein
LFGSPLEGKKVSTAFRAAQAGLALSLLLPVNLGAQCPSAPLGKTIANPNRPTVADPADIGQLGVLELEYGYERDWFPGAVPGNGLEGLLKFPVACNLEIRWSPDTFVTRGNQQGFGDNWIGAQYRLRRQTARVPTLAASYALKIPSASWVKGLGSGRVDHQFKFLASKDLLGTHFDFNASALLIGRPLRRGFDHDAELTLSFSHGLRGKLGMTGEFYGDTQLNNSTPGFVSNLWALTYTITPRLVVDAGMDTALTRDAPFHKRFFMGLVYSLAEVYPRIRRSLRTP